MTLGLALILFASFAAFGALLTLVMATINLAIYRGSRGDPSDTDLVSVCIPARNEEANIEACVRGLLNSTHRDIEVLVYDDESTDATPEILATLEAEDQRVRRVPTQPLPAGWNGKQHGCHRMSESARGSWLLFTDADVRFEPDAVGAGLAFAKAHNADLVSTFPRQIVRSLGELMTVPSVFFVLFSYLPFPRMRRTNDPAAAAGCGQFILARASKYRAIGGHTVCFDSMHDGIKLPRAFRAAGSHTDLFDGTAVCSVRMYRGWRQSWMGFAKNAYEGLGSVGLLVFLSVFHLVAHIAPWVALPVLLMLGMTTPAIALFSVAILAAMIERTMLAVRFRHTPLLAVLHPLTIAVMVAVQWHSYIKHRRGSRSWRGRTMQRTGPDSSAAPAEHVVLVDEDDNDLGTMEKLAAHLDGGTLHRAFSVFLFDKDGRVLMQKRASGKYHFGGLWTNTCCSHPRLGEAPVEAGRRRLMEEMGIEATVDALTTFLYRASDAESGLTEHELDHVLTGRFDGEPELNPDEAEDWRWMTPDEIDAGLAQTPGEFTPWFPLAWQVLQDAARADAASV